jgi:hypothetical protein
LRVGSEAATSPCKKKFVENLLKKILKEAKACGATDDDDDDDDDFNINNSAFFPRNVFTSFV